MVDSTGEGNGKSPHGKHAGMVRSTNLEGYSSQSSPVRQGGLWPPSTGPTTARSKADEPNRTIINTCYRNKGVEEKTRQESESVAGVLPRDRQRPLIAISDAVEDSHMPWSTQLVLMHQPP